jgi:redox-sensing transcriptional repressor
MSAQTDRGFPEPSLRRLCILYRFLEELQGYAGKPISSSQIAKQLDIPAHTIRKDVSLLEQVPGGPEGYPVEGLRNCIATNLGLTQKRSACVAGVGRLGSALLNTSEFTPRGFHFVAGFDKDINKVEIVQSSVPLYPSYEMEEIIAEKNIELGVITVPAGEAEKIARRMLQGGVKGIINFAPVALQVGSDVVVRNIYMIEEFRLLSALLHQNNPKEEPCTKYKH